MKKFVAVAGNIGVGKSTLVSMLCGQLGWQPFFEPVGENPYLADFYQDMQTWSFHSQIFFLPRRLRAHRQLVDHPTSAIQDRSVYEDAEIFAHNLFLQGNMSERDYRVYRELYEAVISILPPPDLVIYLRASVGELLARIVKRGREFEQGIDPAYLEQLNVLYERWIARFTHCPVLMIPTDSLNFAQNEEHLDLVIHRITDKLQGQEVVELPTI